MIRIPADDNEGSLEKLRKGTHPEDFEALLGIRSRITV
jgi:hypothetical protein